MNGFARKVLGPLLLTAAVACGGERRPPQAPILTAAPARVHGVWVWRTTDLLDDGARLSEACDAAGANEVYLAVTHALLADPRLPALVARLRGDGLHVEALMGDPSWSVREKWPSMLSLIEDVIAFDRRSAAPFAAIHLDIEPHTLRENRGADVNTYLPMYVDALREARERAGAGGLTVSADVPRKFFLAREETRLALVRAVPRLFLMLYELPGRAGRSSDAGEEIGRASAVALRAAYVDVGAATKSEMIVGLSVEDYGRELAPMLGAVDRANGGSARYAGWAIHDFAQYVALEERK